MLKTLTSAQCRAGRALVKWSVRDLGEKSGVHRNTISAFETDQTAPNNSTLAVLRAALEAAGVEFIAENGGGPGVRLRKARKGPVQPTEGEGGIIDSNEM